MSQALTTASPHPLRPQNFGELVEFAKMAARSTLVPRDYLGKPENILLAIQMGSEIGLAPMQSLQNISVINGRPAVWGDAMLGLCRQSPVCKDVVERFEGEGKTLTAICIAKRAGAEPIERRFSMDDAERAGLASKAGTWQQYPKRMLQMRARGFALRDAFPDVLRGLISAEEAEDIPTGKTIEGTADATNEPSSLRQAMNDAIPLQPLKAAAAAATPRADRVQDMSTTYDTADDPADDHHDPADVCLKCRGTGEFRPGMKCFACNGTGNTAKKPIVTGKDTTRKPVVTEEPVMTWTQWAESLERADRDSKATVEIGRIISRSEVAEIVRLAQEGEPSPAKTRIVAAFRNLEARYLADPPQPPDADDLDEVVIAGEERLAAG